MKAMEGPQERLRTELRDKKRGTTDKTVYNETELMVKTLRGGGEASLRYSQIICIFNFICRRDHFCIKAEREKG